MTEHSGTEKTGQTCGGSMPRNRATVRRKGAGPARSASTTNPNPHMSLQSSRAPPARAEVASGSLVSILVVGRDTAGRSPSQNPSPLRMMLASFTSPCTTPHPCMHRSAFPTSRSTPSGTLSGAPCLQSARAKVAKSLPVTALLQAPS